jgi:hypothetical protein
MNPMIQKAYITKCKTYVTWCLYRKFEHLQKTTDRRARMKTPKIYYAALMAFCALTLSIGSTGVMGWH